MTPTPTPKKKDLILDTALALFNEQGSQKVTTNHIADQLGISPGNLYYHFNNKEHIIRELLARLITQFDALIHAKSQTESGLDLMVDTVKAVGELIYVYRFIYVELAALLRRDQVFQQLYTDIKTRRTREFERFFSLGAELGIFQQTISAPERDALILIGWTYAEGMLTALHTSGFFVNRDSVQTHLKKIIYIFKAYLLPEIWIELARKMGL